jgi:hypothetical protein
MNGKRLNSHAETARDVVVEFLFALEREAAQVKRVALHHSANLVSLETVGGSVDSKRFGDLLGFWCCAADYTYRPTSQSTEVGAGFFFHLEIDRR